MTTHSPCRVLDDRRRFDSADPGYQPDMQLGTSIFLIAVGAVLKYAVSAEVSGVSLSTVGVILMVVGVIGLLLSILMLTIWADRGGRGGDTVVRDTYVDPADRRL